MKDGDKILDICAGADEYSLYFVRKGYEVSALELADANITAFKKKLTPEDKIDLVQGNALDLSRYADKSFDIVLLFGPLYHLKMMRTNRNVSAKQSVSARKAARSSLLLFPTILFSSPSSDTM